jgi:hypothetical protein
MRRLAQLARSASFAALALLASAEPVFAQEPQAESRSSVPSNPSGIARPSQIERRAPVLRGAPPGFERWLRELRPIEQRALHRRLRRMPAAQRDELFRRWERTSVSERRELMQTIGPRIERRRERTLPLRLRTPEMRDRIEQMSLEDRQRFFARVRDWRAMAPAERHRMRARLESFGALSEADQRALVEQKFAQRKPEERAKILRDLREASQQLRAQPARGDPAPATEAPPARD